MQTLLVIFAGSPVPVYVYPVVQRLPAEQPGSFSCLGSNRAGIAFTAPFPHRGQSTQEQLLQLGAGKCLLLWLSPGLLSLPRAIWRDGWCYSGAPEVNVGLGPPGKGRPGSSSLCSGTPRLGTEPSPGSWRAWTQGASHVFCLAHVLYSSLITDHTYWSLRATGVCHSPGGDPGCVGASSWLPGWPCTLDTACGPLPELGEEWAWWYESVCMKGREGKPVFLSQPSAGRSSQWVGWMLWKIAFKVVTSSCAEQLQADGSLHWTLPFERLWVLPAPQQ